MRPRRSRQGASFAALLELRWQPRLGEIDALAPHRHSFLKQQPPLHCPLWQAAVRPDDPVPRDAVRPGEDETDSSRRARIDVAVRAHETLGNCAHSLGDPFVPRLGLFSIGRWSAHRIAISREGSRMATRSRRARRYRAGLTGSTTARTSYAEPGMEQRVSEGYADFRGYRTWYRVAGELRSGATPLLAVHGGPGSTHHYFAPLERLSAERAVVVYDQIGCGGPHRPEGHARSTAVFPPERGR